MSFVNILTIKTHETNLFYLIYGARFLIRPTWIYVSLKCQWIATRILFIPTSHTVIKSTNLCNLLVYNCVTEKENQTSHIHFTSHVHCGWIYLGRFSQLSNKHLSLLGILFNFIITNSNIQSMLYLTASVKILKVGNLWCNKV